MSTRFNRAKKLDAQFSEYVSAWGEQHEPRSTRADAALRPRRILTGTTFLDLFESQLVSRHIDLIARVLRGRDQGFYTIGSCGHEGNVVLGNLVRSTDPAFLHYRSGALFIQRCKSIENTNVIRDVLLGMCASSEDPTSGGRHKVWGSKAAWVPPQTSTIASHIPKAVGAAVALRRAKRRGWSLEVPDDSIILCTFGDASTNHATALAGFNAARWLSYQRLPVPILFVCEDNTWGISVRTPPGWIQHSFANRPGLTYFNTSGRDLIDAYEVANQAVQFCREQRMPAFLHMDVVRLLGHAGSDMELEYRTPQELDETEQQDPLLQSAKLVLEHGLMSSDEVLDHYESIRRRVEIEADYAASRPQLTTPQQIMASLAPYSEDAVHAEATRPVPAADLQSAFEDTRALPHESPPRHLAVMINYGLREAMAKYPHSLLFGEDVARKGGVYHVTTGLSDCFGLGRVFNTLLDETDILGMALGAGLMGLLPIPEIQYLAYFHNACDQIRGEASSQQFFSNGQFKNPMVVRIASFAYQKGFGGHFHNDNSIAALRDIPGIVIAAPARGDDAVELLRTCMALAHVDGRVVVFLEPIALYMTKGLHDGKDNGWLSRFPEPGRAARLGEGRVYHGDAKDLTIISFCNGVHMSLRAARTLEQQHGIRARVVDLRWLKPLNGAFLCEQARASGRVLIVDESRRTGGVSEAIITELVEGGCQDVPIARVAAHDSFIPLGPAATVVLPTEDDIVQSACDFMAAQS
jgi:2-oxoisovalerate dehydrogenase E1 component